MLMHKQLPRPRAILFDLDNTLYDYDKAHHQAIKAVEKKALNLLGISSDTFRVLFNQARDEVKKQLGNTGSSHSRLLYFQKLIELFGMKTQVLFALDLEQTYWSEFLSNTTLFPHVVEFLDDVRLSEIPAVIVTDLTAQIQFKKLVYLKIDSYFDYIVTSEEAGADKPSQTIFDYTMQKLNLKDEQVWMIGDNYKADILGAKKCLNAITFLRQYGSIQIGGNYPQADVVFDDFSKIRKIFDVSINSTSEEHKLRIA